MVKVKEGDRIRWRSVNKEYSGTVEQELSQVLLVRMDNGKCVIIDKQSKYERER